MEGASTIRISVDSDQVVAMLLRTPGRITERLNQLMEGGAIDVQREERIQANTGVTGNLRQSIRYTYTPELLRAEIKPAVDYAEDVEYGSKARYISVAEGTPLRDWAKLKDINPYALRNSIAKKGTKAHPFIQPTFDKMGPVVERNIATGITILVEEIDRGV